MNRTDEWLEPDGLGGFASGTAAGPRSRRYHGVLLTAATPPTGRLLLVPGFDAWIERIGRLPTGAREFLTSQRYAPDVETESAATAFTAEPWPTWTHTLGDGTRIECELFVPRDAAVTVVSWRVTGATTGLRLVVRPFLAGRDIHALHHENEVFNTSADITVQRVRWQPYADVPAVLSVSNGSYQHAPQWYRSFELDEERARGFDATEDCLSPGVLSWDLSSGPALWMLGAEGQEGAGWILDGRPLEMFRSLRAAELARRESFPSRLHRAADAYLVRRGAGKTIIAGYPWFTDWGRDTFIALRGLCLATGRLDEARDILLGWAGTVSQGMVPNRFVDQGDAPEFNSVDASLWYVIAVWEYLQARDAEGPLGVTPMDRALLEGAVLKIVTGYCEGTRYGIRQDADGLLCCGEPGVQLTWMDAKVGDWVVTPRTGKPVEVQALWLNALRIAASFDARWSASFTRGVECFRSRFWNAQLECLYDVVDVDGVRGRVDASIRPNQIFAVGGLPFSLLVGREARAVFDTVREKLFTPLGLRSLDPDDRAYAPIYEGGPRERDGAYHQGTVWPWLAGAFAEAWLRVGGDTAPVRAEVRRIVVAPLLRHLDDTGLGHISEIADAEAPHAPRGCPFQAWSVGELLRVVTRIDRVEVGARPLPASVMRPSYLPRVATTR